MTNEEEVKFTEESAFGNICISIECYKFMLGKKIPVESFRELIKITSITTNAILALAFASTMSSENEFNMIMKMFEDQMKVLDEFKCFSQDTFLRHSKPTDQH
jgi:hypothetical protein